MEWFYDITPGNVKKYEAKNKEKIQRIKVYHVFYMVAVIVALVSTYFVFSNCIDENKKMSDTIALGSIFATFGSSVVAIFSMSLNTLYDRFISDFMIFSQSLEPDKHWIRWSFIKRKSHHVLYNGVSTYQELTNSMIKFNVGSHTIEFFIPTIKEDFYDLHNWKSLLEMKNRKKDYESYVLNNSEEPAKALMIWDCIYDELCCIAKYRVARFAVVLGEAYILTSIIMAFLYRLV